jgi:Lrp/AsnC family transcriptional regulator for asnA, asnC and gidA
MADIHPQIDKLDLQIIGEMMRDSEISYADLGKKLFVSGGTIHVRIKKLQELGIVLGTRMHVDIKKIGYDIIAFVGIYLDKSNLYTEVIKQLEGISEIVRINYLTGNYSMMIEIVCRDISHLRKVLHDDIAQVKGISRTVTFVSMEESLKRAVYIDPSQATK